MTKVPRGEDPSAEVSSRGGEGRREGTEVGSVVRGSFVHLIFNSKLKIENRCQFLIFRFCGEFVSSLWGGEKYDLP